MSTVRKWEGDQSRQQAGWSALSFKDMQILYKVAHSNGCTKRLFCVTRGGMGKNSRHLKPSKLYDIVASLALYHMQDVRLQGPLVNCVGGRAIVEGYLES